MGGKGIMFLLLLLLLRFSVIFQVLVKSMRFDRGLARFRGIEVQIHNINQIQFRSTESSEPLAFHLSMT